MRSLSELKKLMKGIDTVLCTPFNKDESLDLEGMRSNMRWTLKYTADKDFIQTPVGSTGEFYAMSDEDCKAVTKMVVEEMNGRNVVLAGTGRASTYETIKICQDAQSVGADGAQVVIPYYHIAYEEGIYQHYKKICESVDPNFGIMVYNNPTVSGAWIRPPLMQKISKLPNVIAIKENTPNIIAYHAERTLVDLKDAAIFCGSGEVGHGFQGLYGGDGSVSTIANFAPDVAYSMYEATRSKDFNKINERLHFLQPLGAVTGKITARHGVSSGTFGVDPVMYVSVTKAAMEMVGLAAGPARLPMLNLNNEEKAELRSVLKSMKILK